MAESETKVTKAVDPGAAIAAATPTVQAADGAGTVNGFKPMGVLGDTGLKRFTGMVTEEFLLEMQGAAGIKLLTEMRDNHPVIGAFMHAILMLVRGVDWTVESPTSRPKDMEAADFISSCIDDMSFSWQDTIAEILTMLTYGFSFHEICYKVRKGTKQTNPLYRSRYDDGLIGWDGFPIRSQESLYRWEMDANGMVLGMHQIILSSDFADPRGFQRFIPMEKGVLFRTTSFKNNPHGRSVLRNAVVPYLRQKKIEEIECIGLERDLAGLPVAWIPAKVMGPNADANEQAVYQNFKTLVQSIRRDKMEGIVMPSDCYVDPKTGGISGQKMYDLTLLSTGGQRQFDTNAIVGRYDQKIAMTVLADFLMIGHQQTGGQAVAGNKMEMFVNALEAFLGIITEEFNRGPIPKLLALNGYDTVETPMLTHTDISEQTLTEIADYISKLAASGMPMFPDPALEDNLRSRANLPDVSVDDIRQVGTGTGDRINDNQDQSPGVQVKPGAENPNPPRPQNPNLPPPASQTQGTQVTKRRRGAR